jgi:hypothetical protein
MAGKVHCWYGAKGARSYTEPQPGHRRAHPACAPCHLADHRADRLCHVQPVSPYQDPDGNLQCGQEGDSGGPILLHPSTGIWLPSQQGDGGDSCDGNWPVLARRWTPTRVP